MKLPSFGITLDMNKLCHRKHFYEREANAEFTDKHELVKTAFYNLPKAKTQRFKECLINRVCSTRYYFM